MPSTGERGNQLLVVQEMCMYLGVVMVIEGRWERHNDYDVLDTIQGLLLYCLLVSRPFAFRD